MYPELNGKVMLISGTGGKSGIGSGIIRTMARNGVSIGAFDISDIQLVNSVKIVEEEGGNILPIKVDITNFRDCKKAVEKVFEKFGRIDILVNLAAVIERGYCKWHETDEESFDKIIKVNIYGLFNVCKAVIPYMIKNRGGRIINFSSLWSKAVQPGAITYSASKAFVNAVTQGLALELAEYDITVNAIAPGMVVHSDPNTRTLITHFFENRAKMKGITVEEAIQLVEQKHIPLKRRQEPWEFGELVAYLASDNAKNITGQVISVDGGGSIFYYKEPI